MAGLIRGYLFLCTAMLGLSAVGYVFKSSDMIGAALNDKKWSDGLSPTMSQFAVYSLRLVGVQFSIVAVLLATCAILGSDVVAFVAAHAAMLWSLLQLLLPVPFLSPTSAKRRRAVHKLVVMMGITLTHLVPLVFNRANSDVGPSMVGLNLLCYRCKGL